MFLWDYGKMGSICEPSYGDHPFNPSTCGVLSGRSLNWKPVCSTKCIPDKPRLQRKHVCKNIHKHGVKADVLCWSAFRAVVREILLMTSCMFYSGSASCDLKKHHALCAQKHCVYWWVLLGIDGVGYQGGNISLGDWNWPQQKHWLPWWILVNEFILTNRSLILMCGGPTRMGRSDG